MARVRGRGVLERSVVADIFKNTLSRIPTVYGRLCYLASLRGTHSGTYRHHGLSALFGREPSIKALQECHERVFGEWLGLSLEAKHGDLRAYIMESEDTQSSVVRHLMQSHVYRSYVPARATEADKRLYTTEFNILLEALNYAAAAEPDRESSQLR